MVTHTQTPHPTPSSPRAFEWRWSPPPLPPPPSPPPPPLPPPPPPPPPPHRQCASWTATAAGAAGQRSPAPSRNGGLHTAQRRRRRRRLAPALFDRPHVVARAPRSTTGLPRLPAAPRWTLRAPAAATTWSTAPREGSLMHVAHAMLTADAVDAVDTVNSNAMTTPTPTPGTPTPAPVMVPSPALASASPRAHFGPGDHPHSASAATHTQRRPPPTPMPGSQAAAAAAARPDDVAYRGHTHGPSNSHGHSHGHSHGDGHTHGHTHGHSQSHGPSHHHHHHHRRGPSHGHEAAADPDAALRYPDPAPAGSSATAAGLLSTDPGLVPSPSLSPLLSPSPEKSGMSDTSPTARRSLARPNPSDATLLPSAVDAKASGSGSGGPSPRDGSGASKGHARRPRGGHRRSKQQRRRSWQVRPWSLLTPDEQYDRTYWTVRWVSAVLHLTLLVVTLVALGLRAWILTPAVKMGFFEVCPQDGHTKEILLAPVPQPAHRIAEDPDLQLHGLSGCLDTEVNQTCGAGNDLCIMNQVAAILTIVSCVLLFISLLGCETITGLKPRANSRNHRRFFGCMMTVTAVIQWSALILVAVIRRRYYPDGHLGLAWGLVLGASCLVFFSLFHATRGKLISSFYRQRLQRRYSMRSQATVSDHGSDHESDHEVGREMVHQVQHEPRSSHDNDGSDGNDDTDGNDDDRFLHGTMGAGLPHTPQSPAASTPTPAMAVAPAATSPVATARRSPTSPGATQLHQRHPASAPRDGAVERAGDGDAVASIPVVDAGDRTGVPP
ncbi:hypothetical protein CXG81DRAFT_16790 [Caulochytrium protostelioides]|uniref:Uncharacterized protein n=1 Tax=Caulochytrium protostelioides TaxID=1555241 RepID=A0A4V1IVD6_9FUNG|nr:hypothetical protein CXG81DRAFT_16790 [Caulochytrium protostelioides]|eukprot:RKP03689.1 hypothetical protein CXG81DRAFT_16790 [Caulochytrium protostelioides]